MPTPASSLAAEDWQHLAADATPLAWQWCGQGAERSGLRLAVRVCARPRRSSGPFSGGGLCQPTEPLNTHVCSQLVLPRPHSLYFL